MDDSVSLQIITEIARLERVDATDLEPRLHDVIDPDALESLLEPTVPGHKEPVVTVSFSYLDYEVLVDSQDGIEITPLPADTIPENGSP